MNAHNVVSFKQAKALKELGFPQESESYGVNTFIYLDYAVNMQDMHKCKKELMQIKDFYNGAFDSWDLYIAPTYEEVYAWFKSEYGIRLYVVSGMDEDDTFIGHVKHVDGKINFVTIELPYDEAHSKVIDIAIKCAKK